MPNACESRSPQQGRIVTFYSFKGGTGRTMALANVAWILAANGKRVLIADWDLESPGLDRFFQPFMEPGVSEKPGIIDIIRRYAWAATEAEINRAELFSHEGSRKAEQDAISRIVDDNISRIKDYAIPLSWEFPDGGALHFLSPGKQTNGNYQATLSSLDWDNFYDNLGGPEFLNALRTSLKHTYDYSLIDSRTGLGDIADICTVHLPDVVVDCFTLATQGIAGAARVAANIKAEIQENPERDIAILPVPMRIDQTQQDKVDAGLKFAAHAFESLLAGMSEDERREYLYRTHVPYRHSYAYEEMLAAFADRPGSRVGLLSHYEQLTARITEDEVTKLPPRSEWLRLRTRRLFSRTESSNPIKIVLNSCPEDQLWAEWIAAVLASAEIDVQLSSEEVSAVHDESEAAAQIVAVVSDAYISRVFDSGLVETPDLLISVTDTRLPAQLAEVPIIFLSGLTESGATERLIERLNGRRPADPESGTGALRYPGSENPRINNLPGRNVNFTGRDEDLRGLRDELRSRRFAVVLPLAAIQGLGGVGKTQIALEYAHRFKAEYDIIWWMNCGQPQYVDASLADLGKAMHETFDASVPEEGGVTEVVRNVLQILSSERTEERWLLIYDNAEDIDEISNLLPSANGHVLITSRDKRWAGMGTSLEVNVFQRRESIRHLQRRAPGITDEEAGQVADILGDMPLAVAAAGALLASTDMSVQAYIEQLDAQPMQVLPAGHPLNDYPAAVAKAWNLSLDQLQKKSASSARLLEIFSMMAPDISLELIDSQIMADRLRDLDPSISERAMIAKLIRQIDLLALIRLDNNGQQIQVHRVVQAVVRERMSPEAAAKAERDVHGLVVAARPDGDVDDPQTWPRYRLIWPHLGPSEAMWSADQRVRQLLIEQVRYNRQRDATERALRRAEEIQQAWRIMLEGVPDPAAPTSLRKVTGALDEEAAEALQRQLYRLQFNLANALRDLAQFQEARAVDEAVLQGQWEHLGPEHPHTLHTRSSLAGDLRALGDYKAALSLDQETYDIWKTGYGDEYRGTLSAAHNLALSYLLNGDFRRALAQDRLTLERRTSIHGPTHPRTLNSGSAVARDLLEAGRYRESVTLMERVLTVCHEALGDDDRITLNARLLLGIACRYAGRVDEATTYIDTAMAGLTRGFGRDSSDGLACRLSQALNLLALWKGQEARASAEEVLMVYEHRLGAEHPYSLVCRLNMSTALCLEEDYPAAENELRSVVNGLNSRLGTDHPYTLAANMVLASVRANQGDLTEARTLEEAVVAARERVLGVQHPDTLRCRVNLLLTRHQLGEQVATDERQEVIGGLAALIGEQHPDVTAALSGNRLLCTIDPQPF